MTKLTSSSTTLWIRLARRFGSSASMRRSALTLGVVAAALISLFIGMKSFDQSPSQLVEQTLGRFEHRADLDGVTFPPGAADTPEQISATARAKGADDAAVLLQTYDIRPATTAATFTVYLETNWSKNPFPGRYQLQSGRWPSSPGEVVVTEGYVAASPDLRDAKNDLPVQTAVLSGNASFDVVGHVTDLYATNSSKILAASGTWASLDAPTLSERYPTLAASASLYWSGNASDGLAEAVIGTLDQVAPDGGPAVAAESLPILSRSSPSMTEPHSYLTAIPLAYTIPSLLLPVTASMVAFGLNARRLRKNLGILRSIGVPGRDASISVILASAFWQVVAVVVGSGFGVAIGIAARLVSEHFVTRPLAPVANPLPPIIRTLAITALCASVALAALLANQRNVDVGSMLRPLLRARRIVSPTRRALGSLAFFVTILQAVQLQTIPGIMLLVLTSAIGMILFVPDILPIVITNLPAGSAQRRLARQQLLGDFGRAQTATITVTATLGLTLAMVILLQTMTDSESEGNVSLTAPSQVSLVTGAGGFSSQASPALVSLASASLGRTQGPIDVGFVFGGSPERIARLDGDPNGILLVVDTPAEAARLANGDLDEEAQQTLRNGGLIVWDNSRTSQRLILSDFLTDAIIATTPDLPTAIRAFPASWEAKAAGVTLRQTAQDLGLPTSHSETVYTGISAQRASDVREAALDAGYDVSQVGIYEAPPPVVPPLAYWGSALGLGIALLLAVAAVARAQTVNLRSYLGGLVALGIPTNWARKVLYLEITVIAGVSTGIGLLFALLPIAYSSVKIPGLVFSVPWIQIALLLGLFVLAGGLATWQSSRRLRAVDRLAL